MKVVTDHGCTFVKIVADAIRKEASKYPGDGDESPCTQDEDECMRAHVHLAWYSNGVIGAVYANPDRLAELAVEALAAASALPDHRSIKPTQHCTSEECEFTLSHTASWCHYDQPHRCGCAYCYPKGGESHG